jgi:pyridoxine 5-phosphate synthase
LLTRENVAKARANQNYEVREGARLASPVGLHVAAGHGLTVRNVGPVAEIPEIEEFNIGHSIISQSVFVGLDSAVRAMKSAIAAANI